jgi:hypothetical protein
MGLSSASCAMMISGGTGFCLSNLVGVMGELGFSAINSVPFSAKALELFHQFLLSFLKLKKSR